MSLEQANAIFHVMRDLDNINKRLRQESNVSLSFLELLLQYLREVGVENPELIVKKEQGNDSD